MTSTTPHESADIGALWEAPHDVRPRLSLSSIKLRPLYASLLVTAVVAFKSFQMSYAALHDLSIRNHVAPGLASNVPIAIDGLVLGSIIATASFRKGKVGWWYATILFIAWTMVSVAGNIEYALELGGSPVSVAIYAGMPLTMLFAVHLTLMLVDRRHTVTANATIETRHAEASNAPIEQDVSDIDIAMATENTAELAVPHMEDLDSPGIEKLRPFRPVALTSVPLGPHDHPGLPSQIRVNTFTPADQGVFASPGSRP